MLQRSQEVPALRNPSVIVGLGGWTNAGEVATGSLAFLRDALRAQRFADVDEETYYQYSNSRPTVAIQDGKIRNLSYPGTVFHYWSNPDGPNDLVLVSGTEPDLRWHAYLKDLLDLAEEVGARRICTVGSYFDSIPHTAMMMCSGTSMDPDLGQELKHLGVQPATYFGPTSILTAIIWEANQRRIPAVSVWGRAPQYIQVQNPRLWHEVLWRVLALCKVRVDLAPLRKRGDELMQRINQSLRDNPQLRDYIAQLERDQPPDSGPSARPDAEPLQQEDVLRSVEEFLRGEGGDPPADRS